MFGTHNIYSSHLYESYFDYELNFHDTSLIKLTLFGSGPINHFVGVEKCYE